jgi:head-tail adaptor
MNLLNTTVTRLRAPLAADGYGNVVPDWPNAARLDLPARVQQSSQQEDTLDRDQQTATFVVFLPPGADVNGSDRLEWAGRTLELAGPPASVDAYSAAHHVEARAREVVG